MQKIFVTVIFCMLLGSAFTIFYPIEKCSASANTLYIGGSGPGNYSTIQDAIDMASVGDTVFVYSGLYYENLIVNKTIDLIGINKETSIIDGNGSGDVVKITSDFVNIKGFTIQNRN